MQVFKRDDQTFDPEGRTNDFNWSYYAVSFGTFGWTEGVPHRIRWPFMRRNIPKDVDAEGEAREYLPLIGHDQLTFDINPANYQLLYSPNTTDWWIHGSYIRGTGASGLALINEERKARFDAKYVNTEKWTAGLSQDEMNSVKATFGQLDIPMEPNQVLSDHRTTDEDVQMGDA